MRSFLLRSAVFLLSVCFLLAQNTATSNPHPNEVKGLPPRATPGDYPAHIQVGNITIAAEFAGHSVPRPQDPLSTDDFVIVETGLFGPAGTHVTVSLEDFSLRINDKKSPLPSQPVVLVAHSLRDPEWIPPEESKPKSKTSFGTGGGGQDTATLPPKIPIELQRSMAQYALQASLPEGDRNLPEAGLLFFRYGGKRQSIHSLELIYSGAAGKGTLALQP